MLASPPAHSAQCGSSKPLCLILFIVPPSRWAQLPPPPPSQPPALLAAWVGLLGLALRVQ